MADEAGVEGSGARGAPRIVTANRAQLQLRPQDLESLLPADHRARALWMVVDRLDLSRFYAAIQARGSDPGRPAIDPKVLVALWLYATSEGVGSARELARLCERHDAAKAKARVSMTDPDARVMKMADGGYRPAYNVQLATAVEGRVIVGVQVTNAGTDLAQLTPMRAAVEQRTGQQPREYLVDGGFVQLESIAAAAADGVTVYAPVRKPPRADIDPHVAKPTDAPAVTAWRVRMGTEDAKTIYKDRAAVAETVNADLRAHRGLNRLPVRGLAKVQCIAVWAALTYNVLRWLALTA